jgi:hypothetical protein
MPACTPEDPGLQRHTVAGRESAMDGRPVALRPAEPVESGRQVALGRPDVVGVRADEPVVAGLLEDMGRPARVA